MEKLTPKDIKVKAKGRLIREYIIEEYGSIEEFSKVIGNTPKTINHYLKKSDLGSGGFRGKLVDTLDKCIYELAPDSETQIKSFVNSILHNYTRYRDEEDLKTIEKVMKLCQEENMEAEAITMERNRAMWYFNDKRRKEAIEMLEEIAEKAQEKRFHYHWLYFTCDIAVLHSFMANHKKAEKIYEKIDLKERGFRDYDFKEKGLYKYYYSYGVLCNRVGKYNKAKWLFEESLNYAWSDVYRGGAFQGIGLSYKKKGQYDNALEYYFDALEIQPLEEEQIALLNNIAEVYKQKKEYDKAMEHINKAINNIKLYGIKSNHTVYITYLEIKFLKGDTEGTLEKLMEFTTLNNKERVTKIYIIGGLNAIIDLAVKTKFYNYLFKLEGIIIDIIQTSEEKAFIGELKKCLGSISVFLYKENYKRSIPVVN